MKNGLNLALAFGFGIALVQVRATAQTLPRAMNLATNAPKLSPKEEKENMSYAIGMDIGRNLKRAGVELDLDALNNALKAAMAGQPSKLTDQQVQEAISTYRREAMANRDQDRRKSAEKNREAGEAFLAANKSKPGVKTLDVTLPDGKTAEMQYKVIKEGTGAIPKSNDTVMVTYRGTLIDGKEFDSSAKHGGQPVKLQVNHVIRGWTQALEMMKTGSEWELYLPSGLAYGDNGSGATIEPGATLIFTVTLVSVEAPPAPPPPAQPSQPLTSDIIRVPSAEELKKGAKIEVIKSEDLERLTNAAAQKPAQK